MVGICIRLLGFNNNCDRCVGYELKIIIYLHMSEHLNKYDIPD